MSDKEKRRQEEERMKKTGREEGDKEERGQEEERMKADR